MPAYNADLPQDKKIEFRIGINVGDIIVEGDDIFGDGVNVAARLESISQPGGICISDVVHQQVNGRLDANFVDIGEQSLKNIARPVRIYHIALDEVRPQTAAPAAPAHVALALPDKPSIAVLPFSNMSGDPEQEYFADGMVEDIITALSRFKELFVIARNSTFVYKGEPVDIRQVAREMGVRYVLEGSVRKAGNRVRITGQLIDAGDARPSLGRQIRRLAGGCVRAAGCHHRERCGRAGAELAHAAQTADQPQCLRLPALRDAICACQYAGCEWRGDPSVDGGAAARPGLRLCPCHARQLIWSDISPVPSDRSVPTRKEQRKSMPVALWLSAATTAPP